jgi:hypothetical protein
MIPGEVLADPRLSHRDVRVYGLLTCCRRGCYVSLGRARLAKLAHADRRGIRASVKVLTDCGHIQETREGKRRARFKLLSSWFLGKGNASAEETQIPQISSKIELVRCPRCGKSCRGLLKVGWCRSCNLEHKITRIVDKRLAEMKKTA